MREGVRGRVRAIVDTCNICSALVLAIPRVLVVACPQSPAEGRMSSIPS
jgi:hypothetical protein